MKKIALIIVLMVPMMTLNAQQPQSPMLFHNHLEYVEYLIDHPRSVMPKALEFRGDYSLKLDSIVGSDNFDWNRWKKIYTYSEVSDIPVREEIRYEWENQTWISKEKTVTGVVADEALVQTDSYRWTGEEWDLYLKTLYRYDAADPQQLQSIVVYNVNEMVEERYRYTTYEYNDLDHLLLVMNYNGADTAWIESSKYEYAYNAFGLIDTCLYSTIRNGSWRESQRLIYSYNENQQCNSVFAQRKGGGGPFGNSWMDSYKYEFVYQDGALVSELYYSASGWGWFGGGELSLNSKVEYNFDANGNLLNKTASVFNEQDWVVRDVYENRFDLAVDAATIQGLAPIWESTIDNDGMGFALDLPMALNNKWLGCSIVSSLYDTEFSLYYSGFADVEEHQEDLFTVCSCEGRLVVECDGLKDVTVYDLLGRVVASKNQVQSAVFELKPGLYVVGDGSRTVKAIVR